MKYVLVVWTNMSDMPHQVETGNCFTTLHTLGCEMEDGADNFERYEVMSIEKYQDLRDEDYWYCWEEQEYTESGRYEDMPTDNQLNKLTEGR